MSIVFFIWYVAAIGQNVMVGWFSAAKLSRFCDMYLHFFVRLLYNSRKKGRRAMFLAPQVGTVGAEVWFDVGGTGG